MTDQEKLIIIIYTDHPKKADAIILLEGDGYCRVETAADLYLRGFADKIVFSGGITNYNYGSYPLEDVLPFILKHGVPESDIIHEKISKNTREQAFEIVKIAIEHKWKKLILVASHYHQYRAYLTVLKAILDQKADIVLYSAPARNLKWFDENHWGRRYDLLEHEFQKITDYSEHIATVSEAIKYYQWKEQQE